MIVSLPAGGAGYLASPGGHPRLRRPLRQARMGVPHRARARRVRRRHLARRRARHRQRRAQLGRAHARRGARHRLHPDRHRALRLLRRQPPRREPLRATASWRSTRRTGKRLWHFQAVHHDLWDYDLATAPKLLTVKHDGRDVDVVAQASKHGFLFVFDRVIRAPLWPIEERPVPQSDVPGEQTSPTQPFPTLPPPVRAPDVHRTRHQPVSSRRSPGEAPRAVPRLGEQRALHAAEPAGQRADAGQQRRRELGPVGRRSGQGHDVRHVEGTAGDADAPRARTPTPAPTRPRRRRIRTSTRAVPIREQMPPNPAGRLRAVRGCRAVRLGSTSRGCRPSVRRGRSSPPTT